MEITHHSYNCSSSHTTYVDNSSSTFATGLPVAVDLLKSVADKYDGVSYADLFQMASAQAIEVGASARSISY